MKTWVSTFLMTALVTAFYFGDADAAVDRDIVLAMPFDEGRGKTTKDLSPHGNHGTLKRSAKWGKGKFGNAVQFEPVGYVDAGDDESLSLFKSDYTLAVWFNLNETVGKYAFMAQDEGRGEVNKWILGVNLPGSNPALTSLGLHSTVIVELDGGAWRHQSGHFGPGDWNAKPKEWRHFAVVRDRHLTKTYNDGEETNWLRNFIDPHQKDDDMAEFINAPVTIGWAERPIAMDGLIDEVLIAKRAFTAGEIKKHYNGGVQGVLGVLAIQPEGKSAATWGAIKANILH